MGLPVRIVLVGTSHPGNIGAVARAMKNMGLERLVLVRPKQFPSPEAEARAAGADDILEGARVCDTLDDALAGCGFVAGASARLRSLPWPLMSAREAAAKLVAEAALGEVAVVFGSERVGLSNDELARCHALLHIPTAPGFSSLNLAMAVQVVVYEVLVAAGSAPALPADRERPLAPVEDMEHFYAHLERALVARRFLDPDNPKHLMRRIRRLFNRAEPDTNEINILRGIIGALAPDVPAAADDGETTPGRTR
jgi:TrmH family RNA methyltransferase